MASLDLPDESIAPTHGGVETRNGVRRRLFEIGKTWKTQLSETQLWQAVNSAARTIAMGRGTEYIADEDLLREKIVEIQKAQINVPE